MTNDQREQRVAILLSQDRGVTEPQLKEYRMALEMKIDRAERMARRVRWAIYVALAIWLASLLVLPLLQAWARNMSLLLNLVWVACFAGAPLCAGFFLILHAVKYRPAIVEGRSEQQNIIIAQLQLQVAELSRQVKTTATAPEEKQ